MVYRTIKIVGGHLEHFRLRRISYKKGQTIRLSFLFCIHNSHCHNALRSVGRARGLRVVVVIDAGHKNRKSSKSRPFGSGWRLLAEHHCSL